jgi:hypothetical protein
MWKPAQYSTHEFVITRKAGNGFSLNSRRISLSMRSWLYGKLLSGMEAGLVKRMGRLLYGFYGTG